MTRRGLGLALVAGLLTAGCGLTWPAWLPCPACAVCPTCPPVSSPRADPGAAASNRTKRLMATRADLKAALTALELRAVSTCDTGRLTGAGCVEIQQLIDQGRALDERLVKALLDPTLPVDWPAVTATLRAVVVGAKAP